MADDTPTTPDSESTPEQRLTDALKRLIAEHPGAPVEEIKFLFEHAHQRELNDFLFDLLCAEARARAELGEEGDGSPTVKDFAHPPRKPN